MYFFFYFFSFLYKIHFSPGINLRKNLNPQILLHWWTRIARLRPWFTLTRPQFSVSVNLFIWVLFLLLLFFERSRGSESQSQDGRSLAKGKMKVIVSTPFYWVLFSNGDNETFPSSLLLKFRSRVSSFSCHAVLSELVLRTCECSIRIKNS